MAQLGGRIMREDKSVYRPAQRNNCEGRHGHLWPSSEEALLGKTRMHLLAHKYSDYGGDQGNDMAGITNCHQSMLSQQLNKHAQQD